MTTTVTIGNKNYQVVQLIDSFDGMHTGLYFVPIGKLEEFEKEILEATDQNVFDEENKVGAIRVTAEESILDINLEAFN